MQSRFLWGRGIFTKSLCFDFDFRLSLTSCNETQFNCASAFCLSMDMRCDGRIDCLDKTDEKDCHLVRSSIR